MNKVPSLPMVARSVLAVCGVLALMALWLVDIAQAAPGSIYKGAVVTGGVDGTIVHSGRIAVDPTNGSVYVADDVNDQIVVYRPTVSSLEQVTAFGAGDLSDPYGVAVDPATGAVYVSDAGHDRIVRYTTDGADTPTFTLDGTFATPPLGTGTGDLGGFAVPLAVEPGGKLLVADAANGRIERFATTGAYDNFSFDGAGTGVAAFDQLQDLAVDSTGDIVVVDADGDPASGANSRVLRYSAGGSYEATIGPVAGAATIGVQPLTDNVIVSGNQDAVNRDQAPTASVYDASGVLVEALPIDGGANFSTISGVAGGPSGRWYVSTDVSRGNYPGGYGPVSIQIYNPALAPAIDGQPSSASGVTYGAATLTGTADPRGQSTALTFEYGTTTAYGASSAATDLGAGDGGVTRSTLVSGLQPDTTYHFRAVAENATGRVVGTDHTFTTTVAPPAATDVRAIDVTPTSVTLQATVDPHGIASTYRFTVAGVTVPHSQASPAVDVPAQTGPYTATATFEGLPAGARFAVSVTTTSATGSATDNTLSLTTPANPPFIPAPPRANDQRAAYGCMNPVINTYNQHPRPGSTIVLTGTDLGVGGTVAIGDQTAIVTDYRSDAITAVVPSDISGTQPVTVNCGAVSNTIGLVLFAQPSNDFTLGKVSVKGSAATISVKVPGAGRLTVAGSRLRAASLKATKNGTVKVIVHLSAAGAKALRAAKSKHLSTTAKVTFTPSGGTPASDSVLLTFSRKATR